MLVRKKFAMGKIPIKGGTPIGSESLCRTCSNAHIMTGYRESERITICDEAHPNIVVPFLVYDCTRYWDKNRPDWEQMQKLAIDVSTGPLKPVGFKTDRVGFHETTEPNTNTAVLDEEDDD